MSTPELGPELITRLARARSRLDALELGVRTRSIGRVVRVGDGVATVRGLPDAGLDELLLLGEARAMAVALDRDEIGCVLLDDPGGLASGAPVRATGQVVRVPVGDAVLGRVLDPVGRALDGGPPLDGLPTEPVERPAPEIVERAEVSEPLLTGVLVVDAMLPLGRGQRQLVVGDRKTGKTSLALEAMVRQRDTQLICIYVAIGQKSSTVTRVVGALQERAAFERCAVVVAEADAAPGLQWVAPFAACTLAEHFRDRGQHVLVVFDDLTRHASVHREISLLLRAPPGREAYPGDVFYLHARLLERAAKLSDELGGGSISALPIVETQEGNLSAYIPTNLVSITDGQITLDPTLFYEDQKPAVDVGRSVSRVGGRAQPAVLRALSETLRLEYAQFLELEVFTRFGGVSDERTRAAIEHGRRMRAVLSQGELQPWSLGQEVALLLALAEGVLDAVPLDRVDKLKQRLPAHLEATCPRVMRRLEDGLPLAEADRATLVDALRSLVAAEG